MMNRKLYIVLCLIANFSIFCIRAKQEEPKVSMGDITTEVQDTTVRPDTVITQEEPKIKEASLVVRKNSRKEYIDKMAEGYYCTCCVYCPEGVCQDFCKDSHPNIRKKDFSEGIVCFALFYPCAYIINVFSMNCCKKKSCPTLLCSRREE